MPRQLRLWSDLATDAISEPQAIEKNSSRASGSAIAKKQESAKRSLLQVFTNPDRQIPLDRECPAIQHDEDTITIDRPRADIDGPAHRFTIKRTDFVEVFLGNNEVGYGTILGIAPERGQARIEFDCGEPTGWFDIDQIYPAIQPRSQKSKKPKGRVKEIEQIAEALTASSTPARAVESIAEYTSIKIVSLMRIGTLEGRPKITSTADACKFFAKYWEVNPGLDQERFMIACLDTKHRVQCVVPITVGTLDASLVHPREVFKPAIVEGSSAILLSHNHPSGDPTPSKEDHDVTRRLTEVGELIGITVLDHIVHGDGTGNTISIRET